MTKPMRSYVNFQKSKLSRIRSNSLRQNRNEQYNQTTFSSNDWIVKSGCHFSCIENSMGIQIISSKSDHTTNIQLCNAEFIVSKQNIKRKKQRISTVRLEKNQNKKMLTFYYFVLFSVEVL